VSSPESFAVVTAFDGAFRVTRVIAIPRKSAAVVSNAGMRSWQISARLLLSAKRCDPFCRTILMSMILITIFRFRFFWRRILRREYQQAFQYFFTGFIRTGHRGALRGALGRTGLGSVRRFRWICTFC